MSIESDIQSLSPGTILNLYILDIEYTVAGAGAYYFYPGVEIDYGPLSFGGQTYSPWPVKISGMAASTDGAMARPTLRISNFQGLMTVLSQTYEDIIGAKVSRVRTFEKYLDSGSSPDPTAKVVEEYYVNSKSLENRELVEYTLASATDLDGQRLPSRTMVANSCPWKYRAVALGKPEGGCDWPGTDISKYFTSNGTPTALQTEDVCGKRLSDCELRFGTNPLPYGGFVSMRRR